VLIATIVGLLARLNIVALAMLQMLVPLITLVWATIDHRVRYQRPLFSFAHADWRTARAMVAPSALFAFVSMANGIVIQGSVLFVSSTLGPTAVTVFATSRTLANTVRQGVSLLHGVAWPEFTRLKARGEENSLANAHRLLVKLSCVAAVAVVSGLWFNLDELFQLWTGKQAAYNEQLLRLLLAHALLQTPWWSSAVLLTATNHHRTLALLFLAQGALTAIVVPLMLRLIGMSGVGVALLVVDVPLFGYLVPAWAQRLAGETAAAYMRSIYGGLALVSGGVIGAAWLLDQVPGNGTTRAALLASAVSMLAGVGGWLWLQRDERELIVSAVRARLVGPHASSAL
jgi:O-antigen/teichoic acid export membrane protein